MGRRGGGNIHAAIAGSVGAVGEKGKGLYDTAQLEEKQFNKLHATKLTGRSSKNIPTSPYANQAKARFGQFGKSVLEIHQGSCLLLCL